MYGFDNPYSPNYWENCTTPDCATRRLKKLDEICGEYSLTDLQEKIRDKSARILEVGCWNWIFLDTLLSAWFKNIRWLDMFPRHSFQRKDLEEIVECDCLQFPRSPIKKEERFDIVCSHLVFDESCYREQQNEWFRDAMLEGIYNFLSPTWLYFASENHDRGKIIASINKIPYRWNTYLWEYGWVFLPAKT